MTIYRMGRPVVKGKAEGRKAKPTKKKRKLAPRSDRDMAAWLVAQYRADKTRIWIHYADDGTVTKAPMDGDFLALRLEEFAKTGTFGIDAARQRRRRNYRIRAYFAELYPATCGYEDAVEKCVAKFDCSGSTVRAVVGPKQHENGVPILK